MRAADVIEKITRTYPEFLEEHNQEIIDLIKTAFDKELKWHLALLSSRLDLTKQELETVWSKLTKWALDKRESKIVRVNSIQSLYDFSEKHKKLKKDFDLVIQHIKTENIPSLDARLRKLKIR